MAARKAFKQFQPEFIPYVEKENVKEPAGQLEIFDAEYDRSAEVENVVRIVPKDVNTRIKIFGVRSFDELLQRDHFEDLVYNGTLELRLNSTGVLNATVPIEFNITRPTGRIYFDHFHNYDRADSKYSNFFNRFDALFQVSKSDLA